MNLAGNSSNPTDAIKARPAKRDRRQVSRAVRRHAQVHTKANSAKRGEVSEVLGQAAQNTTIPARLAARNKPANRIAPSGLPWAFMGPFLPNVKDEPRRRLARLLRKQETRQTVALALAPC